MSNDVRLHLSNVIRQIGGVMNKYILGDMEKRFANLIWEREPIETRELIKLCLEEFNWKRTTMYTMLKRLCERGIFENRKGLVIALISRDEFLLAKGEIFIDESFGGSLPRFILAFAKKKKISDEEIRDIKAMIEEYKGEEKDD